MSGVEKRKRKSCSGGNNTVRPRDMKGPDESENGERFGKTGKENVNWTFSETELER